MREGRGREEGGRGREREREGSKLWESGVREIPDDNMCCPRMLAGPLHVQGECNVSMVTVHSQLCAIVKRD